MVKSLKIMAVAWIGLLLPSCQPQTVYHKDFGDVFHTVYHITYAHPESLKDGIVDCLNRFDASLSMFNPNSTLSYINRSDTLPIDLSHDAWVCHLLDRALDISSLTEGAFDITVAPLVNLWGFGTDTRQDVSPSEIDSILEFIGYRKLSYQDSVLRKSDARMKLDASAIAKGYACDIVGEWLESQSVENYLVEIGGEIRSKGKNERNQVWTIGIDRPVDDPQADTHELQAMIQISGKGMATSGNYRRFYLVDGRKVAHSIDPHSGYPAVHSLLSATVVADDCLTADALATSFMVMGLEKATGLAEKHPEWLCYFIYSDAQGQYQTWSSPALEAYIK